MKKPRLLGKVFTVLIMFFLYAPIFVLIVFSFNSTKSRTIWSGFTLDWYAELFQNRTVIDSLYTTIEVSVLSSLIATVLGTFFAIGLYSLRRKWRQPILTVSNIPVINADIITGVSLSLLFVSAGAILGVSKGMGTLLLAHLTFNIPYVVLSVMPKLHQLDQNLFEAARDLGCSWIQAMFKVIIPQIRPGIVNGMLIAFTMSVDDFVISYFTAGSEVQTLSMTIYAMTRKRVSPEINAISTLLFVVVLLLLIVINVRSSRQEKKHELLEQ